MSEPVRGYVEGMAHFKRELLAHVLRAHGGNRTHAARALGLQRTHFVRLIRELGLAQEIPPSRKRVRQGENHPCGDFS